MPVDVRTISLTLSIALATAKTRYALSTLRSAFKSTAHLSAETDLAASASLTLPVAAAVTVIATEDSGLTLTINDGSASVTVPLNQFAVLPGSATLTVTNTATAPCTLRYIVM